MTTGPAGPAVLAAEGEPALHLRPWAAADAEALALAHRDAALRRRLATRIDGVAEARRWIEAQAAGREAGTRHAFAVVAQDDGRLLGHVAVKRRTAGAASAEIGYWTAAAARGRGVAPRAVGAVTAWVLGGGLDPLPARLELLHDVDNTASCRVAVKCGFALHAELDPYPPQFPQPGHLHVHGPAA
ncbi:GNAT family N-acetyltransferase [Streptomyces sp. NPDC020983]|uniref:GNAT family N-acetyltransferase n=1 Tax=Streptomyces sp. NPDC020983 TaxID=3365106 RepID=UPI0037A5EBAD